MAERVIDRSIPEARERGWAMGNIVALKKKTKLEKELVQIKYCKDNSARSLQKGPVKKFKSGSGWAGKLLLQGCTWASQYLCSYYLKGEVTVNKKAMIGQRHPENLKSVVGVNFGRIHL